MKANPLIIAVGILAVLGGAVYYTQKNPPKEGDERPELVSQKEDEIQKVEIHKKDGETIVVERGDDGKWKFGGGLTIPADDSSIGLMVSNLAGMDADRVVEDQVTDWSPYGLEDGGVLSVEMTPKEGEPKKIIFGKDTPTGSGVFARIEGDPRLFTVYNYVKSSFDKKVFDWRDKKLLHLNSDKISRVRIHVGKKDYEFGKAGESDWQILKPKPVRADNFAVGDLARAVENVEMTAVLEEGGEPSGKYSFRRPYATAEVVDDAGAHKLTIAKDKDGNYYAKSSDLPGGVYEISSSVAESLDKKFEDLRNKKLFDFGFSALSRLQVRDGDKKAVIEKKSDDWVLASEGDRKLDSEKVQKLIDALRNLTAIHFSSDTAADQSRYGLDSPAIEAEATKEEEGVKPERVLISDPSKAHVYAARAGEASTYEVEKAPVEEIRHEIAEILKKEEKTTEEKKSGEESEKNQKKE